MKKFLFLTALSLCLILPCMASAETIDRTINFVIGENQAQINGETYEMTAPAQVVNGSTMVPLRFISTALGCDVNWNGETKTVTVNLENQFIEVPVGQSYAVVNGTKTDVKVPAQFINGSTYVPLRFVSENLGSKVDYDAATKAVTITLTAYINNELGYKMVVPAGWTVDAETEKGVEMSAPGSTKIAVYINENTEAVTRDNFSEFADACFKEYADKGTLYKDKNGITALIMYKENGTYNIHSFKLIDTGIFSCVFATPEESLNTALAGGYDILVNSMKTPAAR